ncbi:MAG: hypothetical protein FJ100_02045 [Deltaproteobacteria bacterium]|nr:hypothetical protein [Deltaproteobacteria bacterium]
MPRSILLCAAVLAVSACGGADRADQPRELRLTWRPTDDLNVVGPGAYGAAAPVRVDLFIDRRANQATIGEDARGRPARPLSTPDLVPAFVSHGLAQVLPQSGVPVVEGASNRVLRGAVQNFFVREDNTYNGEVAVHAQLQDGSGTVLYDSVVVGRSKRWGRSASAENYAETYSNAVVEIAKHLLADPRFRAALGLAQSPLPLPTQP